MSWSPRPDLRVHRWWLKSDVVGDELNSDYSGTDTHGVDDAAMRVLSAIMHWQLQLGTRSLRRHAAWRRGR